VRRSFSDEPVRKNRVLIIRHMNKRIVSPPEELLSRRAIAARWQCSVETIKRTEKAGLLRALRFNSRLLRYKLADVIAYENAAAGQKE